MISNNLEVKVNVIDAQPPKSKMVKLTPENNLSTIREILRNDNTIKMDVTLLFSKKFTDNKFAEISYEDEKDFILYDIIGTKAPHILYLKKTYWKFLNDSYKLDFGCTMTSNGIRRANQRAFEMEECQLDEIDIKKKQKEKLGQLNENNIEEEKFDSLEDWMIKKNHFYVTNMNVEYFARIGIKHTNEYYNDTKNSINKYRVYRNVSFEIIKLRATNNFAEKVKEALKFEDPKKFIHITEEFGQFIPTKIILGKRFQINDQTDQTDEDKLKIIVKDQTEDEEDLLYWDIIELLEPISIFEFVSDGLRKELYSFFGKRILYSEITSVSLDDKDIENDKVIKNDKVIENDKVNKTKIIKLPKGISEIISNEHADCSIFATAIGKKDYYHCQILTLPDKKPSLIVHHFKKKSKSKDSQLTIGWIVVGYDTNFRSIFPDYNTKSFNNMQFKVLTFDNNLTNVETAAFDINPSSTEKHYYIGIPYTENKSDLVIDHYFSNDRKKLYTFSYSSKDKQSAKLSKFSFHLLEMTNSSTIFEKYVNHMNNTINLDNIDELKNLKKIPKFISLYSKKEKCRPILLKQRPTQIKVKFFNNKFSFDKIIKKLLDSEDIKCSFFVPFESDKLGSNSE